MQVICLLFDVQYHAVKRTVVYLFLSTLATTRRAYCHHMWCKLSVWWDTCEECFTDSESESDKNQKGIFQLIFLIQ